MRALDPKALDALAAYKRSRSPDASSRDANWAAIANTLDAEDIATPTTRTRSRTGAWIAVGLMVAAAAGLVAGLTLAPRRAEPAAGPTRSAAAYAGAGSRGESATAEVHPTPASVPRSLTRSASPPPAELPSPALDTPAEPDPVGAGETEVSAPRRSTEPKKGIRPRPREVPVTERVEPASALREQAALVRGVRAALADGEAREAMRLVRDYRDRFPGGVLTEEIAALELAALCRVASEARWRKALEAFDARYPGSPLRAGVREDCFDER